jgi:hypothetical protein
MSRKRSPAVFGLAALTVVVALPASAQVPPPPGGPPRIEVNPHAPVHRRCASWYVIQYRPSGTVLFPEKHCWWERG